GAATSGAGLLARTVATSPVVVAASDLDMGTLPVTPGLAYVGNVSVNASAGTTSLSGSVVQVFCQGPSAACPDPGRAIAEAVVDVAGQFKVTLPDPRAIARP
ncbi:MAG: hypothetical protein ABUL67_00875, partial [Haliangium ochraceum]